MYEPDPDPPDGVDPIKYCTNCGVPMNWSRTYCTNCNTGGQ